MLCGAVTALWGGRPRRRRAALCAPQCAGRSRRRRPRRHRKGAYCSSFCMPCAGAPETRAEPTGRPPRRPPTAPSAWPLARYRAHGAGAHGSAVAAWWRRPAASHRAKRARSASPRCCRALASGRRLATPAMPDRAARPAPEPSRWGRRAFDSWLPLRIQRAGDIQARQKVIERAVSRALCQHPTDQAHQHARWGKAQRQRDPACLLGDGFEAP